MTRHDWFVLSLLVACVLILAFPAKAAEPVSLVFEDVTVSELAKVAYGEIGKSSYILPSVISDRVTVRLQNIQPVAAIAAVDAIFKGAGYKVERRAGLVWIAKSEDDSETVVYSPRHRSARYLSDVVQAVTGARSLLSRGVKSDQVKQTGRGGESPTSALGQIDKAEVDQIAFSVEGKHAEKVRKLLGELDTPTGEVVLRAAVFEVGTDRTKASALQIAASILGGKLGLSLTGGAVVGQSATFSGGGFDIALNALDAD